MTWRELIAIEPRLEELRRRAAAVVDLGPPGVFCRFVEWQPLKAAMRRLLDRHVEQLGAEYWEAHDEALRVLLHELPECRGCRCGRALTRDERRAMRMHRMQGGHDDARGEWPDTRT